MIEVPDSPTEIDRQFGLFLAVFLLWGWAVAFSLVMVWRTVLHWKRGTRQFSLRQMLVAVTVLALSVGLAVALTTMLRQ
jgi:hypothetical protein